MLAVRPRAPKPGSFTKKEPFYDNEISGFSMVEPKNDSMNRISDEQSEEREKLARLSDNKATYELKLAELLKESHLSPEDNLTVLVVGFLGRLYQHPNTNMLLEQIQKLFSELKAYE
jgi:hypothetical protein